MGDPNPPAPDSRRSWQKLGAHAQSILEFALDAVITIDHTGVVLAWNPQAEAVFHWTRDEILGRPLHETIIPPSDRDAHRAGLNRFLLDGHGPILSRRFETSAVRKDGARIDVELTVIPESTPGGWVFTAFLRDISERRRADAALRDSEERFRNAFVNAGTGMLLTSLDGKFLQVNRVFAEMLGYSQPELVGKAFNDVTHPDDRELGLMHMRRLLDGEVVVAHFEKRYLHRDGREIRVLLSPSVTRDAAGRPVYLVTRVQDVSRWRAAEEELRASEEKFRSAFDLAPIGMSMADLQGRFIQVNREFCRIAGRTEAELLKMSIADVTFPEDREESALLMKRIIEGGRESGEIVKRYARPDGSVVWGDVRVTAVRDGTGAPRYAIAQIQDITRRKQAEEALSASEKTYRLLFEDNPNPMWVFDAKTLQILAVNEAAVALYGYARAEFRDMTIRDVQRPDEVPALLETMRGQEERFQYQGEWTHVRKGGAPLFVEVSTHGIRFEGRPAVLAMIRDLTERKKSEEALRRSESQLAQAAKMEAVGRLAGGVAHDLNNLLTIIQGYGQLLSKKLARGEGGGELDEIRMAAQRGNSLTQQLLAFSRRQVLRPKVLDLNAAVKGMDQLLRRVIGAGIELVVELGPGIGCVKADPGQLDQVVLNLALNARDAMPQGGKLTVTTGEWAGDPTGGPWVTLDVRDTGCGMDAGTMAHIFEPFFTTKEGRGTGLGLATVYGIVRQSGGHIRVESEPGKGSRFRVLLPRHDGRPEEPDPAPASGLARGSESVLVVEDEPRVRSLVVRVLREIGYTVYEAPDADEADRVASDPARKLHLLLTDVVLPRTGGPEIARRLAAARPGLRVLFTSGYLGDTAVGRPGGLPADSWFLPKPFTDDVLARRVREVLDAPAPNGGNGK